MREPLTIGLARRIPYEHCRLPRDTATGGTDHTDTGRRESAVHRHGGRVETFRERYSCRVPSPPMNAAGGALLKG
jgi:hypothetical protein